MSHKETTLAIAAIVAAVAMTGVAFAIPQQALAYGHHYHDNSSNSIKASQEINQANQRSGNPTTSLNDAHNDAGTHR